MHARVYVCVCICVYVCVGTGLAGWVSDSLSLLLFKLLETVKNVVA